MKEGSVETRVSRESISHHLSNINGSFTCRTLVGKESAVKSTAPPDCSQREACLACEEVNREGRRQGVS